MKIDVFLIGGFIALAIGLSGIITSIFLQREPVAMACPNCQMILDFNISTCEVNHTLNKIVCDLPHSDGIGYGIK